MMKKLGDIASKEELKLLVEPLKTKLNEYKPFHLDEGIEKFINAHENSRSQEKKEPSTDSDDKTRCAIQ